MFSQSKLVFGVLAILFLLGHSPGRAQEEKPEEVKKKEADKKATEQLLRKAEEEYRIYFKKPVQVHEFWAAIKLEIELGKFDLAAFHLKELLKKPADEADKELVKIEAVEGLSAFLRLQTITKWSEVPAFQEEALTNVKTLIDRATSSMERHLSDPERITKFISQLDAPSVEERTYAFVQLKRARARATPYLVQALRVNPGKLLQSKIVDAMVKLDPETVPPLFEILKARDAKDAQDLDLRLTLLDIIKRRADKRAIPYLWHLSSARMYPDQIRVQARDLLGYLLETPVEKLTPAYLALTDLAERHYQHQMRFPPGKDVRLWPWDGQEISVKPTALTPSQAEEFFGLRYAREALDLDPTYQPAQVVFLSLLLERAIAPGLEQFLLRPAPPKLQQLLATIDGDLLDKVLERAMNEGNVPVILPLVQALGERGDLKAAKVSTESSPKGVIRAMYFPDRRVQYAAVKALLRMPSAPVPVASTRMVEVLRRFLAAGANPKALIGFMPLDKAAEARKGVKEAGFEPVLVQTAPELFARLKQSADYDLIFLGSALPQQELPYLLTQLRSDPDHGNIPIMVFAPPKKTDAIAKLAERYRNVNVYSDFLLSKAEDLKNTVEARIKEAGLVSLTPEERKEFTRVAMDVFWRMARGEIQGHDLRPAQEAIVRMLANPDMVVESMEILGRLPGHEPQARLARVILEQDKGKLRTAAAVQLNRHIQRYGVMLGKNQVKQLKALYKNPEEDPDLRAQLALVMGSMQTTPQATGVQLFQFRPDSPAPPEKKEKEKEKE